MPDVCPGPRGALISCPFLRKVAADNGEAFALRLAVDPLSPVGPNPRVPVFPEEEEAFEHAASMVHGFGGVLPLPRFLRGGACRRAEAQSPHSSTPPFVPFASIGFSMGGFFGRRPESGGKPGGNGKPGGSLGGGGNTGSPGRFRGPPEGPPAGRPGAGSASTSGSYSSLHAPHAKTAGPGRPAPRGGPARQGPSGSRGSGVRGTASRVGPPAAPRGALRAGAADSGSLGPRRAGSGGRAARAALGGLLPLPSSHGGRARCPGAVVRARAALGRLGPIRRLRQEPVAARMLGAAVLAFALNAPLGAAREHTRRLSPSWFVAVHAAVPLVAATRKALLLSRPAMGLTLAAAVAGQVAGSRLERRRLAGAARPLTAPLASLGTSLALHGVPAAPPPVLVA